MQSFLRKVKGLFGQPQNDQPDSVTREMEVSGETLHHYSFVIGSVFTYYNDLS